MASRETSKALRHGSHSFTCKLHHACLDLVSIHLMALPLTCDNVRLIAAYYSSIDPKKDERLSWLTATRWVQTDTQSGWFTHISGHPSAVGWAQDRESSPVKDDLLPVRYATNRPLAISLMSPGGSKGIKHQLVYSTEFWGYRKRLWEW